MTPQGVNSDDKWPSGRETIAHGYSLTHVHTAASYIAANDHASDFLTQRVLLYSPTNSCFMLSHIGAALIPLATRAKNAFFTWKYENKSVCAIIDHL